MIELRAADWWKIPGLGKCAAINPVELGNDVIHVGDKVSIDGSQFVVLGIEQSRTLAHPPKLAGLALRVREVAA